MMMIVVVFMVVKRFRITPELLQQLFEGTSIEVIAQTAMAHDFLSHSLENMRRLSYVVTCCLNPGQVVFTLQ